MATIICGWCNDKCHMTAVGTPLVRALDLPGYAYRRDEAYVVDGAFTCDGCGRMSVATWVTSSRPEPRGGAASPAADDEARWSPTPGHNKEFPDVPPGIADAAQEAWRCYVAGAPRGAIALARAVIEATAKNMGHVNGTLFRKIEALASSQLVRPAVKDQAHAIRYLGNDVAHGDLQDPATREDAEEVLELMGEVLNEVFQSPERSTRLRAKAEAKKAAGQATEG